MGPLEVLVPRLGQLTMEEDEKECGGGGTFLARITFISLSYTEREQHTHAYCTQVTHRHTAGRI